MTDYVVGFMFNKNRRKVLLIKKIKPEWQNGLLNGIGGKIESGESPIQAMVREFKEETGIITIEDIWEKFCIYTDTMDHTSDYKIHFFRSFGNIYAGKSTTSEKVFKIAVEFINQHVTIYNLRWLIPLALDDCICFPIIVTE